MKAKVYTTLVLLLALTPVAFACEVCEAQQPKILRGAVHGPGPGGFWDYTIAIFALAIVIFTLVLSVKYLMRPEKDNPHHIKNIVLDENQVL